MVLGGLWHGAAWTFVLWGFVHGIALAVEHSVYGKHHRTRRRWLGWIITMIIVLVGWVLFRSTSVTDAATVLQRMVIPSSGIHWCPPLAVAAISLMFIEHWLWKTRLRLAMRLRWDRWYSPIATSLMIWSLVLYAPQGFTPFVYFQF